MIRRFARTLYIAAIFCPFFAPDLFCEEKPEDAVVRVELGMMQDGSYTTASVEADRLLEKDPDDARVLVTKAAALYGLMDYAASYEYFKKAEEKGRGKRHELTGYAIKTMDDNRDLLWEMQANAKSLESASPDERETFRAKISEGHLGMLSGMLGGKYYYPLLATAHIIWLQKNASGEVPGLYGFSAKVYYSAMLYRKAAGDFEKAVREFPGDAGLLKAYADCLVAMGDFDKAGESYSEAAKAYRKDGTKEAAALAARAEKVRAALPLSYKDVSELIEEKRYDEAEAALRKRLSLNGADYAAVLQLGILRWDKGQKKEAEKYFARAAKMAPDYPTAHFYLGKAMAFRRDTKNAVREFGLFKEKMDLLPPMDDETVDFYVSALQYISYIHSTLKEYKSVIKESEKILKLKAGDQDARYNLGIAYYYLGKVSRAYEELNKAIEADPDSRAADLAKYCIDYIRSNPDHRVKEDFSFIQRD